MGVKTTIIVIGAGYSGLICANRLASHGHSVTLINPRAEFVDRIRLHEIAANSRASATHPLSGAIRPGVTLVIDEAVAVHSRPQPCVQLASGGTATAHHVVLAVGSGARPGLATLDDALRVRSSLTSLGAGGRVRIDGAGLSGVEAAAEVATQRPDLAVELLDPQGLLPATSTQHRAWLAQRLARLGVSVGSSPTDHDTDPADLVIDCRGFAVPSLARDSNLPIDAQGRVSTDACLRVPGHPGVWATGDAAAPPLPHMRGGCASAEPAGAHVADAIHATSRGQAGTPIRLRLHRPVHQPGTP